MSNLDFAALQPDTQLASAITPTQAEAVARAKQINPGAAIHVERVHNTSGDSPDKCRKP